MNNSFYLWKVFLLNAVRVDEELDVDCKCVKLLKSKILVYCKSGMLFLGLWFDYELNKN